MSQRKNTKHTSTTNHSWDKEKTRNWYVQKLKVIWHCHVFVVIKILTFITSHTTVFQLDSKKSLLWKNWRWHVSSSFPLNNWNVDVLSCSVSVYPEFIFRCLTEDILYIQSHAMARLHTFKYHSCGILKENSVLQGAKNSKYKRAKITLKITC